MTIWKYPLIVTDIQTISIPKDASLLSIQVQNGTPFVWALVNPQNLMAKRDIQVYGTGHEIDEIGKFFIGTFQLKQFVFHAFDMGERE